MLLPERGDWLSGRGARGKRFFLPFPQGAGEWGHSGGPARQGSVYCGRQGEAEMAEFRRQIILDYAKWTALSALRSGAPTSDPRRTVCSASP
jgi:hypothetical protein